MVPVGCACFQIRTTTATTTTTTTTTLSSLVSSASRACASSSSSARRDELLYCGLHRLRWGRREARRGESSLSRAGAWRWGDDDDDEAEEEGQEQQEKSPFGVGGGGFEEGVRLFNQGHFYECHDVLERMWYTSPEPRRSVLHGILQCSVGLHHLLDRNHKGAMAELGEGLAKLCRQRFNEGPFQQFQQEMTEVLQYIYDTQLEYAACAEDLCITMDGSEQSYKLLGNFAAGQSLYEIQRDSDNQMFIYFIAQGPEALESQDHLDPALKVRVPLLNVSMDDLRKLK